jgi:hypothetical protein
MGRRKVVHSGQGQDMFRGGARVIMIDLVQSSVLDDDDLWGIICERSGVDVVLDLLVSCWCGCTKKLELGVELELDFEGQTSHTMKEVMCNMLVLGR